MTYSILLFRVQCLPFMVNNLDHVYLCFIGKREGEEIIWLNVEIGGIVRGKNCYFQVLLWCSLGEV